MSSYYTTAQLEEMRRERLRQELERSIQSLAAQLQVKQDSAPGVSQNVRAQISVHAQDNALSGHSQVDRVMIQEPGQAGNRTEREDLDLSGLLEYVPKASGGMEAEIASWLERINERPILTEADSHDRKRLLAGLAQIVDNKMSDVEDRLSAVKMRVTAFLECGSRMTPAIEAQLQKEYAEYCALCQMVKMDPVETEGYRVHCECARLKALLEKRKEHEYVMDVVRSAMEELGCHSGDDAVLDRALGQMFAVDGHPLCNVFVGSDGTGIMFEPVGVSRVGSLDQQRQMENSANSICSMYAQLEQLAADKGVILKRVYCEGVDAQTMCVQSDVSVQEKKKQHKNVLKEQTLGGGD